MDKNNFDAQLNNLRTNHQTFKRYLGFMITANIILVVALLFSLNREKIVLVPQTAPEFKLWVSKSQVSPDYLNTLSRNVLDLLLNITPNSVAAQQQELMRLVAPKYRDDLQLRLADINRQITQNNLSQNFYIENIRIVNNSNVVYVEGDLNQYIDKNVANTTRQTYKLTFGVNNYYVQLQNVELISNSDPQLRDINHG